MEKTRQLLKEYFGYDAFRAGQEEVIDRIVAGRDALSIMPTGGGKSICYQLPALALGGVTLVISPLISLMADQVSQLVKRGIRAAYINSTLTPGQVRTVLARALRGEYRLIYCAPERLDSEAFLSVVRQLDIRLLVVDEAHCISEWGQDFRPSYRKIADFTAKLAKRPVIAAFTATATDRVREDIEFFLKLQDPYKLVLGFDRPNLSFFVEEPEDKEKALLKFIRNRAEKCGIVYCLTRKQTDEVTELLLSRGISAAAYHAGLSEEERKENQEAFLSGKTRVIVATNAFGMGIDKPDVAYVLHYSIPLNLEHYYQEAGRAGRNGEPAECMLYFAEADVARCKWLLENSAGQSELSPELEKKHLEQNQERLALMVLYCKTYGCLRNYILRYFGEEPKDDCGKCSRCTDPILPKTEKKQGSDALYKKLAAKRNEIAKRKRLPAYVVFTNETLQALAEERPKTYYDFIRIYGIGKRKAELYASDFLAIINGYTTKKTANSGKVWSADEIRRLKLAYFRGKSIADIAKIHERSEGATRARVEKFGLT